MKYIEFISLPGVGKTTITKLIKDKSKKNVSLRSNKRNLLNLFLYIHRLPLFLNLTYNISKQTGASFKNSARRAIMVVYGPLFFKMCSDFYLSDECSIIYLSSIGFFGEEWTKFADLIYPNSYKSTALFVFLEIDEIERKKRRGIRSRSKNKNGKTSSFLSSHKKPVEKQGISSTDRMKAFSFWKKCLTENEYKTVTIDVTHLTAEESASMILEMIDS